MYWVETEGPLRQRGVELPRRHEARHRAEPEARQFAQLLVDLGELRNPRRREDKPVGSRSGTSATSVALVLGGELGGDTLQTSSSSGE